MYIKYQKTPTKKVPEISTVQKALNNIRPHVSRRSSFNWTHLVVDGLFGEKTRDAIAAFQEIYKLFPLEFGVLGDTTYNKIIVKEREIKTILANKRGVMMTTSTSDVSLPNNNRPSLRDGLETIGNATNWSNLILESNAVWINKLIDSLPKVYLNVKRYNKRPAFLFNRKNDYYHSNIYRRVNVGVTLSHYLSVIGFVCDVMTIGPKIVEYRNKSMTHSEAEMFPDRVKLGGEILSLILSTPDFIVRLKNLQGGTRLLITGAGNANTGIVAILSRFSAYIGAFLLGWTIGELIGKIPCGDGHNVQYYIDRRIDEIWEHPFRTIGLMPNGLWLAGIIAGWKEFIDWQINSVSCLKPLSEREKRELEQYIQKLQ